jgi:hypothetical protein
MGGGDRCSVGVCNNDRRYPEKKASKYQSRYINIKAELFYLKVEKYFNNFQFIEQFIIKGPTILLREARFFKIINIFVKKKIF